MTNWNEQVMFGVTMEDLILDLALAALFSAIKNPQKVAKLKAALRKLRDALNKLPLDL